VYLHGVSTRSILVRSSYPTVVSYWYDTTLKVSPLGSSLRSLPGPCTATSHMLCICFSDIIRLVVLWLSHHTIIASERRPARTVHWYRGCSWFAGFAYLFHGPWERGGGRLPAPACQQLLQPGVCAFKAGNFPAYPHLRSYMFCCLSLHVHSASAGSPRATCALGCAWCRRPCTYATSFRATGFGQTPMYVCYAAGLLGVNTSSWCC
jgi:hypothetical protein